MNRRVLSSHKSPQGSPFIVVPAARILQREDNRKQRNGYPNQKGGIAFLQRGRYVPNKQSGGWFRPVPTKDDIIQLSRQYPQSIPYVYQKLNFSFNSIEEFEHYISSIDPNDINFLNYLRELINQSINQKCSPPPNQIEYPFPDIRYSKADNEHQMLCPPIILGASDQEISLNPPQITTGNHIILQSFISGVQPPVNKWPQTLSIYVNDTLVKPPCITRYLLVDLTYFGQINSIRITFQKERNYYILILREAIYRDFDEIVKGIYNLPASNEFFREEELSLFCPISGEMMKDPGKGRNCNHTQSFDLTNFLRIATIQHRWSCPVCNKNLEFSDLIYSHESKKKIDMFKSSNSVEPINPSEPSFFNDISSDFNEISEFNLADM